MPPTSPVVVVANAHDDAAARWCGTHAHLGLVRMTPADLSRPGWVFRPADPQTSTIVADGRIMPSKAVSAVITRMARVEPSDLPHITDEDRDYVGAEMTALLLAWLAQLRCPVYNRPTPQCLAGPAWRAERWARTALALGIPTNPTERDTRTASAHRCQTASAMPSRGERLEKNVATVSVIGDRAIGAHDPMEAQGALALARAAGADLLAVDFRRADSGLRFVGAHPWPDLDDREVAAELETLVRVALGVDLSHRNIA